MPFIAADTAPSFELHGAAFTGLASPSRGSTENAVWLVSREETLVCIEGRALARLGSEAHELTPGSALVIPAGVEFSIRNPHPDPFKAVAVLPVGGQAEIAGQAPFTPPWAR
jgi:uncharacterized protein YjlB